MIVGRTLKVGVGGETVLGLGDTDWEMAVAVLL